ncbi:MAG: hypothetical protein EA427_03310 [Spirochaetaceae bacterium]|nr:MAG: hypothetical protein EA427_03310 [Spirochaetaceae bacterium]
MPASAARELAEGSARFDLFDPPERGEGDEWRDSCRPLVIALPERSPSLPGDCIPAGAILVWGHHRLPRRAEGMIPAILIAGGKGGTPLLAAALAAENRAGSYRWPELDRICRLAEEMEVTGIAHMLDPTRDLPLLLPRYRALPDTHREALAREEIDLRTAERLGALSSPLLAELLSLGESLSFSRRRQYLIAAEEVLRRGMAEEDLLGELRGAVPAQRFEIVMAHRYPRLRRMESLVERVRRRTLRGTGVRIDPPERFEGSRYRVSFDVGSPEELRRRLEAAGRLEKELDELLGILYEDPLDDTLAR